MLLRTQKFQYSVVYKRGKEMHLADTLNRAVSGQPEQQTNHKEAIFYTELEKVNSLQELSICEETRLAIQQATREDSTMNRIMEVILVGWPEEKQQLPHQLQDNFTFRDELSLYTAA